MELDERSISGSAADNSAKMHDSPPQTRSAHGPCGLCSSTDVDGVMPFCTVCYDFFHPACVGLTVEEAAAMGDLERSLWACADCGYVYNLLRDVRKVVVLHQNQPSSALVRLSAADRESLEELMSLVPELGADSALPDRFVGAEPVHRALRPASAYHGKLPAANSQGMRRLAALRKFQGRYNWGREEIRMMAEAVLVEVAGMPEPFSIGGKRLFVDDATGTLEILARIEQQRKPPVPPIPPPLDAAATLKAPAPAMGLPEGTSQTRREVAGARSATSSARPAIASARSREISASRNARASHSSARSVGPSSSSARRSESKRTSIASASAVRGEKSAANVEAPTPSSPALAAPEKVPSTAQLEELPAGAVGDETRDVREMGEAAESPCVDQVTHAQHAPEAIEPEHNLSQDVPAACETAEMEQASELTVDLPRDLPEPEPPAAPKPGPAKAPVGRTVSLMKLGTSSLPKRSQDGPNESTSVRAALNPVASFRQFAPVLRAGDAPVPVAPLKGSGTGGAVDPPAAARAHRSSLKASTSGGGAKGTALSSGRQRSPLKAAVSRTGSSRRDPAAAPAPAETRAARKVRMSMGDLDEFDIKGKRSGTHQARQQTTAQIIGAHLLLEVEPPQVGSRGRAVSILDPETLARTVSIVDPDDPTRSQMFSADDTAGKEDDNEEDLSKFIAPPAPPPEPEPRYVYPPPPLLLPNGDPGASPDQSSVASSSLPPHTLGSSAQESSRVMYQVPPLPSIDSDQAAQPRFASSPSVAVPGQQAVVAAYLHLVERHQIQPPGPQPSPGAGGRRALLAASAASSPADPAPLPPALPAPAQAQQPLNSSPSKPGRRAVARAILEDDFDEGDLDLGAVRMLLAKSRYAGGAATGRGAQQAGPAPPPPPPVQPFGYTNYGPQTAGQGLGLRPGGRGAKVQPHSVHRAETLLKEMRGQA